MAMQSKILRVACVVALALGACTKAADDDSSGDNNQNGTAGTGVNPMAAAGTTAAGTGAAGISAAGIGAAGTMVPLAGTTAAGTGAAGTGAAGTGGVAGMEAIAGAGGTGGDGDGDGDYPDPRGTCPGLDSGFMGDDTCIAPPDPAEGFQIHIGPEDYTNPGGYLVPGGTENSVCANFHLPTTEEKFYQGFVVSARPGTHHIINTMYIASTQLTDGQIGMICLDPGTGTNASIVDNLPGASKPYMPRYRVAPENATLGRSLPAGAPSQADMHYFNFTEDTLVREFWMNIYYIDKDKVTDSANQIRAMGGLSWLIVPIPAGWEEVYKYETNPITEPGRILSLLGHYHAHGKRFTAHLRKAGGERIKVFEMYDYLEPKEFNYNSITTNPGFTDTAAGAFSGMLEVAAGDVIEWECDIVNDSSVALTYSNQVENGEMCNLWGSSLGFTVNLTRP